MVLWTTFMILLRSFLKLETPIPFQCKKKHQYILHNFCFYDLKRKTNDFERNKGERFFFFWVTCPFNGSFYSCVCLINENWHLAVSSTALPPSPSSSFAFSLPHALLLFSTPPILQHYTVAVALLNPRDPQPPAPCTTPTLPSHEEMLRRALKSQSRYGSCFQNAFHSEKKEGACARNASANMNPFSSFVFTFQQRAGLIMSMVKLKEVNVKERVTQDERFQKGETEV